MRTMIPALTAFTLAASALAPSTWAQQPPAPTRFAAPVRLMAGNKLLGEHRLFPSPVFHDIDGDGLLDIVVGDLFGAITVALRQSGTDSYAAETKLQAADGKDIRFHNW